MCDMSRVTPCGQDQHVTITPQVSCFHTTPELWHQGREIEFLLFGEIQSQNYPCHPVAANGFRYFVSIFNQIQNQRYLTNGINIQNHD